MTMVKEILQQMPAVSKPPGEVPGNVVRYHPGTARPHQLSQSEPLLRLL
jgi:hypothetical protein